MTDREPPYVPGLAFRSDGRTLLHVAHLTAAKLEGRETWSGVVLTEDEAADALEYIGDGCDEAAGRVTGYMLYGRKRGDDDEPGEGSAL
jgi:hypothetical protein